jgi:hypothetical protein
MCLIIMCLTCIYGCKSSTDENSTGTFTIPSAKKIDSSLKAKVDEQVKIVTASSDENQKKQALSELEKICKDNPSDFSLFSYLMEKSDVSVARVGLKALEACYAGAMSDEKKAEEFEILSCVMKHPVDYFRSEAITCISYVSDTDERMGKQKELLKESLKDKSPHVRINAIQRLTMIKDDKAVELFNEMLNSDKDPLVQARIIECLNRLGVVNKEKLMELIENGEPYVKSSAIVILSGKKDKDLIPKLVVMLDNTDKTVIGGKYDDGTATVYMAKGATLQKVAVYGLEEITGKKFQGKDTNDIEGTVKKWKEWYEKEKAGK